MFRGREPGRNGKSRWARMRRRVLMGALGLVAVGWVLPVRVGVVMGHSMDPTLRSGQLVAVDRDYSRRRSPAVGDVVFFRGEHGVYVKRVHAVGGQTVYLVEQGEGEEALRVPVTAEAARRLAASGTLDETLRLRRVPVPEGTFFAIGDALENSEDSRDFGPVPVETILGRVLPIGASLDAPRQALPEATAARFASHRMLAAR